MSTDAGMGVAKTNALEEADEVFYDAAAVAETHMAHASESQASQGEATRQHTSADAVAETHKSPLQQAAEHAVAAKRCRTAVAAAAATEAALTEQKELTEQLAALNDEQCQLLKLVIEYREAKASKWDGQSKLHKRMRANCDRDAAVANERIQLLETQVAELELRLGLED